MPEQDRGGLRDRRSRTAGGLGDPGLRRPARQRHGPAHGGNPPAGGSFSQGRHRPFDRDPARASVAEDHGCHHRHAGRRPGDPVPEQRQDPGTLYRDRPRPRRHQDQPAELCWHRRHGVLQRRDDQHPLRLRRSPLRSELRHADRLFHPFRALRAGGQQGRPPHRRHPGAEQARRPLHGSGRGAPQGLHRPDRHLPRECPAVRRRPEH